MKYGFLCRCACTAIGSDPPRTVLRAVEYGTAVRAVTRYGTILVHVVLVLNIKKNGAVPYSVLASTARTVLCTDSRAVRYGRTVDDYAEWHGTNTLRCGAPHTIRRLVSALITLMLF